MTRTKAIIIGMLVLTLLAFGIVALAGGGFGRAAAGMGSPTAMTPTGPARSTGPATDTAVGAAMDRGTASVTEAAAAKGCTVGTGKTHPRPATVVALSKN